MSERYSRLFTLPENLYSTGAPVMIAAGALLKDNQTGKVIAQLKLRSISPKTIKAVKVKLHLFDTAGNPIGESMEHSYLDLNAARDTEFGQKSPIAVPEAKTRSYQAAVTEVVFADNTIWNATEEPWASLPRPVSLEKSLIDCELIKQYRIKFGADCRYNPTYHKDLWYCTCGELNNIESTVCHHCRKNVDTLLAVDLDALKQDCSNRVAEEKKKAAEEKAAAEAKAKKNKRIALITVSSIAVVVLLATLISSIIKRSKENAAHLEAYNSAVSLLEDEYYFDAIDAFSALGDYKDSKEKLTLAQEGARIEMNFVDLMAKSIVEAAPLIGDILHPSEETMALIAICEKYLPYCGTFAWLSEEGYAIDMFSFESDFYVKSGSVYWVYDDSEYEFLDSFSVIYADPSMNNKTYKLLREPLQVEDMSAYEHNKKDLLDLLIRFENDQIYADFGYFEGTIRNGALSISNTHQYLFTMEATK